MRAKLASAESLAREENSSLALLASLEFSSLALERCERTESRVRRAHWCSLAPNLFSRERREEMRLISSLLSRVLSSLAREEKSSLAREER